MRKTLRTTLKQTNDGDTVTPSKNGVVLASAVSGIQPLTEEVFSVEMAKVASWTGEDMKSDAYKIRMASFYEMLVEAQYTESEFKEHVKEFLKRAYPRWMPKDFFQTERAKLHNYAWYLEQCNKGNRFEVEAWILPNGKVAYKSSDGIDVPHAVKIIENGQRLETPEAVKAIRKMEEKES